MKRLSIGVAAVLLVAAVAAGGYWAGFRQGTSVVAVPAPIAAAKNVQPLPSDEVLALKAKIAGLEQRLNALQDESEALPAVAEPVPVAQEQQPRPAGGFQERMERMKQENPEAYAEMQKRREEFRARMKEAAEKRAEFFASFNQSNMSPEHKANYDRLNELQAEFKAVTEARENGQEIDREALRAKMEEAREVYAKERQYLLEDLGRTLGSDENDFAAAVSSIIGNTDPHEVFHAVGGRPRGPRQ